VIVPPDLSATRGQNLVRYGKKAKLGHVTPHALRHSAAELRRETGASIEDVGALLNQSQGGNYIDGRCHERVSSHNQCIGSCL